MVWENASKWCQNEYEGPWNIECLPSSYLSWFLASSLKVPMSLLAFIPFLEEAKLLYLLLSATLLLSRFYLNAYSSKEIYLTTPPKTPIPSAFAHRLSLCLALTTLWYFCSLVCLSPPSRMQVPEEQALVHRDPYHIPTFIAVLAI